MFIQIDYMYTTKEKRFFLYYEIWKLLVSAAQLKDLKYLTWE